MTIKIIAIADSHIGADRFGATPERWDSPVAEAFQFAVDNKADLVLSAGDFVDKRNPTVAELLRRRNLLAILGDIPFWEADGNHDRSNAVGSHSALEIEESHPGRLFQGAIDRSEFKGLNIIGLPWPRPVDYLTEDQMTLSIDEKIRLARERIMLILKHHMKEVTGPTILFGHAMLIYGAGATEPTDPGLILGKDVTLEYQKMLDTGLTANQTLLGHVHQRSPGYIGSTHPTDWSDWQDDKSFVELDIEKCKAPEDQHKHPGSTWCSNGWAYDVQRHSYSDQIRLHDIVLNETDVISDQFVKTPIDVVRVTVNLAGNATAEDVEAEVRGLLNDRDNYARLDRVIINHPKREAARVETEVAMADMDPAEAFQLWMGQAGYSAEDSKAPHAEFKALVEVGS